MSYAKHMPTVERAARTDSGLASELRISVMRLRRRLVAERHPDNELSLSQMAVLGQLFRNGDQTVGDLATAEGVQPPSMTRTVKTLEAGGYVARRKHDSDGRQVVISILDSGVAVVRADRARRDAWLSRRLADLTPEDRAILRQAAPIIDSLTRKD
jgi:DNA-binding MarR family transcriptional regulator